MLLDRRDVLLQCGVELDTLGTQYQLMQVLAVCRLNLDAGTDVLRNKRIIKDSDLGQRCIPGSILENMRRTAGCCQDDVGWMN